MAVQLTSFPGRDLSRQAATIPYAAKGIIWRDDATTGVYNTPSHHRNKKAHENHHGGLPHSQGPIFIQSHNRAANAEQLETGHLDLPLKVEVPNR